MSVLSAGLQSSGWPALPSTLKVLPCSPSPTCPLHLPACPPPPACSLQKHGMKSASKRERARHAAEEEADEMMALKDRLAVMNEEVSAGLGGMFRSKSVFRWHDVGCLGGWSDGWVAGWQS